MTPLLLVEPHGTFMVGITLVSVAPMVTGGADDVLVSPQYEPVVSGKYSVQMVSKPVPLNNKAKIINTFDS